MKKLATMFVGSLLAAAVITGCSYGGVAVSPNNQAVVMRNDALLFGALRKAYVCKVTDAGLTDCATTDNP